MPNYLRVFEPERIYFLTIITQHRKPILLEHTGLLSESLDFAKTRYGFKLIAFVYLPDHLHLLIKPDEATAYPDIVRTFKSRFSRQFEPNEALRSQSMRQKGEKGIWQRRYFEHTIRDTRDFELHLDYIHFNPVKHEVVTRVEKHPYSSFHAYVRRGVYDRSWGSGVGMATIKALE